MRRTIRLTERDLTRLVRRVINESAVFDELKAYYSMCVSQLPNPRSNKLADLIYDSIDGLGTDEVKLISVFKEMKTFDEFCSTIQSYSKSYRSDMLNDIDNDVDTDNIWKELGRSVRNLYYMKDETKTGTTSVGRHTIPKKRIVIPK